MRPETTALLDQADAASDHAAAIMTTRASHDGTPIRNVRPGPVTRSLITAMNNAASAGKLTLCPHLSPTAPAPAWWCAWAPGRLRCDHCTTAASLRIKGTREDRRCDHCRKIVATIHADMAALPAIVIDLPPWPPACIPPVTMVYGLCPACQETDTP
jgi:hypothetical protein